MSDAELSLTLKTSITSNQGLFIFILILIIVNKFLNKLKCNCFFSLGYFNKCKTGIEPTAMSVIGRY